MSLGFRVLLSSPTGTRAALLVVATAALAACTADPVVWNDSAERRIPVSSTPGAPATDAAAESLAAAGVLAAVHEAPASEPHVAILPTAADPHACPASLRLAAGRSGVVGAVWWSVRANHSAALEASRSADSGRSWSVPTAVDTLDRSDTDCDRPAPSIAIDSANGYLHVAYSMEAPEGKGIFYAHQMDPRGPFERPQAVVYGDRPAATSVASAGDLVVVAYEDPNTGGRPFVSLALSHTSGHSFAERFAASEGSSMSAERPVVAVAKRRVALAWIERTAPRTIAGTDDPRSVTTALPSDVVVRVGQLPR